jgi:hypothetical protein
VPSPHLGAMALQRAVYRPRDAEHTVLIRPVHRSIDGGGLSGLASRSPGSARSTREKVADVHYGIGLLRRSASESVWEVMSRGRGPRGRCPPPEGVEVAYPRKILLVVAFAAPLAAEAPRRALLRGSVGQIAN